MSAELYSIAFVHIKNTSLCKKNRARSDIYQRGVTNKLLQHQSPQKFRYIQTRRQFESKQINSYFELNTTFETALGVHPILHIFIEMWNQLEHIESPRRSSEEDLNGVKVQDLPQIVLNWHMLQSLISSALC